MADRRDRIFVDLDAAELRPCQRVGELIRQSAGATSVISFAYDAGWVADNAAFALDPSLPLYEGDHYPPAMPGAFADAAPDRWGRTLIERREALLARREGRAQRHLDDWDFLVGVNDAVRMGALRFTREDGAYVGDDPLSVPPLARLRELEHWARELEEGLPPPEDDGRWIELLLAPGSSLGGARPKAGFVGDGGSLWIAKFPSREDRHDVGAWEYVTCRLAERAGIDVPEATLLRLGSTYRTYGVKRFDRSGEERRAYVSAMTLVGSRDHEAAGYLDIAKAIVDYADPSMIDPDLRQLFRRVVFNVLVSNHDDHLRNHGFLRGKGGWRLAPAFDVNPSPHTRAHSLALGDAIRSPDLDVVRETAPLYRLSPAEANEILDEVRCAVAGWRAEAESVGLPAEEIARLAPCFDSG